MKYYIGHHFKTLHFLIEQNMNRQLTELDLTHAQGRIIGFLRRSKLPPCARDIEAEFGLSHPTVSGLLNRMEAKGFIELRSDTQDRRVKRIFLLEKGYACSNQIWSCIEESEKRMTNGFTPEEKVQLCDYLRRVINNLSENSNERSKL